MKFRIIGIALLFFLAAFLILFEQYLVYGVWWSMSDFLHHENFAFGFLCLAAGLLLGKRFNKS